MKSKQKSGDVLELGSANGKQDLRQRSWQWHIHVMCGYPSDIRYEVLKPHCVAEGIR